MRKILYSLVLLAIMLVPAFPAYAQGSPGNGRVVIGQDFTLKSGDTLNGDLVVIGGQATIEKDAAVNGDVVVIGGSLQIDGRASGNAVVIGGVVAMGDSSSVAGDLVTIGGTSQRAAGAHVGGNIVSNLPPPTINVPTRPITPPQAEIPPVPLVPPVPGTPVDFGPLGTIAAVIIQSIFLGLLALTLTLFLHPQLDRVAEAIVREPVANGAFGLLSVVGVLLALGVLILLSLTLILIPITVTVAIVLVVLIGLAWLFGVIALGMEVGDRIKRAFHTTWEPALSAGIGTFALGIAVGVIGGVIPCGGFLAQVLIGLVVVGAAVMTRFGTQPILRPLAAPPAPASPSGPEAPLPPAS